MECPICGDRLREVEKYGVKIEICPGCKGVWLDRGELEAIVETASRGVGRSDDDHDDRRPQSKKTTRSGLLGNLMDTIGGGGGGD